MSRTSTTPRTRLDRAIPLSAAGATRTPEGYLRVPVRIAKPGVMTYVEDGRTVRELVTEDALSDPAWLSSMEGKPMTLHHPAERLGPKNVSQHQVGTVLPPVHYEGGYVLGDAMITDAEALQAVEAGTIEVSPAYTVAEMDETPGIDPVHGPYDRVQRRRTGGNHLALTDTARGGRDIRLVLRADAVEAEPATTRSPENPPMAASSPLLLPILMALALDPAAFADDAAAAAAIGAKCAQMQAAMSAGTEAVVAMDEMAAVPAMMVEVAEAGPEMPADACAKMDSARRTRRAGNHDAAFKSFLGASKERARLDSEAAALGIPAADMEKVGARGLRRLIAAKLLPDMRADASDTYVSAALDIARSNRARNDSANAVDASPYAGLSTLANPARTDSAATPELTPSEASWQALTGKK